ncbi:HNH endonuclease [Peribacillus sp. SCS-37]|uniref:HNH endonuclease n=1 Tax=Paraperibacillus esterisolvens TaxID=3115296 RepID=UPI003905E7DD
MSVIRNLGKLAGKTAGIVVGGPIQLAGELIGVELIQDIGKGVRKASEIAGDTAGQAAAGAAGTVSGLIREDAEERDRGLKEMGSAVSRTAKGVAATAVNTIHNGGEMIGGFMDGDHDRLKKGASSIVKTVAIGALAVGVVDVIDGVDGVEAAEDTEAGAEGYDGLEGSGEPEDSVSIETVNDHLAGSAHPETGVPFFEETVEMPDGQEVTGVFPEFDTEFEVEIDENLYLQSDYVQFSYANHELYEEITMNPDLAADLGLTTAEVHGLSQGDTPDGYTWHHYQEPGTLQLVENDIHAGTGHTGGRELWGGGEEYR